MKVIKPASYDGDIQCGPVWAKKVQGAKSRQATKSGTRMCHLAHPSSMSPGEHTFYSKFFQNYPLGLKSSKKSYFGKSGKIGLVFYCRMGSAKSYAQIYF